MVIILQPNSEQVGKMRLWLWDFVAWAGREWNLVQDGVHSRKGVTRISPDDTMDRF
jgi:hypothetical protein